MKPNSCNFTQHLLTLAASLAMGFLGWPASAEVLYVKPNGDDSQTGASWQLSKRSVTNAMTAAASGDQIWVVAGRYSGHLVVKPNVAVYGGFTGVETNLTQRNWLTNPTILDGSTNGIVVDISGGGPETVIDGFTIQNGNGTGIRCFDTGCTIRNNLIRANLGSATLAYGGGISVKGVSPNVAPIIERNRIIDNYTYDGGGIGCIDASPRIAYNVIAWNTAQQNGGGISCWRNSSPRIEGNVITGNTASWVDATVVPVGGGGIFATADDLDGRPHPTAVSAPVIRNNVVSANGAKSGGGIALIDSNGGVPVLINNTVVANNGSGIFWGSSALPSVATKPILQNNLIAFNPWGLEMAAGTPPNPNIQYNCIYGNTLQGRPGNYHGLTSLTGTNGNIAVDPQLVNYLFGNTHLQSGSPCVDAGKIPDGADAWLDVDEQNRVLGKGIDIGADESDGKFWSTETLVVHVRPTGDDTHDGRSWTTAKKTLQAGIDAAKVLGAEVWVAAGTYREHIVVPAFVYLYGGFAGTETDRAARDIRGNPSILDGEGKIQVVNSRNAGYFVSAIDGFTVQNGGKYTGGAGLNKYGIGGIGGAFYVGVASPRIANNLITRNGLAYDNQPVFPQPPSYGAGLYCYLSYADIVANTIRENEILNDFDGSGAGIYCDQSAPMIRNNIIAENHAVSGAAIYGLSSSPQIIGNLVQSNAMYNTYPLPLYLGAHDGAITLELAPNFLIEANTIEANTAAVGAGIHVTVPSAGKIQNNLILGNRAYDPTAFGGMAGGIYCLIATNATENIYIVNNTIVSNVASGFLAEQGGAMAISLPPPADKLVIANNVMVANSSGIFQTLTQPMSRPTLLQNDLLNTGNNYINLAAGATDISRDPQFQNPSAGDYRLKISSPAIDAGTPFPFVPFDKAGIPRSLDGNHDGLRAPDLGAWEFTDPRADSDGDGMPDVWELASSLNPVFDDSGLDRDNDGMSNLAEFLAGTDPTDSRSWLKLQANLLTPQDGIALRWASMTGRIYRIDFSETLPATAGWQVLTNNLAGTGSQLEIRESASGKSHRFYRLSVRIE